jgi:hypothetical protein
VNTVSDHVEASAALASPAPSATGESSDSVSEGIQPPNLLDTQPDLDETQGDDGIVPRTGSGSVFSQDIPDADAPGGDSEWGTSPPSRVPTIQPSVDEGAEPSSPLPPIIALPAPLEDDRDSGNFRMGDVIGNRYAIRHIVRGGMGIIYLCYDQEARETVAIKTFQGRFLDSERAFARFVQEARTWIRLEKHPHIVQARLVKEYGNERVKTRPHIILEHIVGPEGLGPDLKSGSNNRPIANVPRIGLPAWACSTP